MATRIPSPALTAFMDRGAREDAEGAMCLAACLFKRTRYQEFERRWRTLHRPLGVDVFHACDFYPGGGAYRQVDREKKEQIARQIPALLNATLHQVVAVTFRRDEFWRVAGDRWRARYGPSLYSAAVQLCLGCTSGWADERRYPGTIDYKIEAGEEDQAYADAALVRRSGVTVCARGRAITLTNFSRSRQPLASRRPTASRGTGTSTTRRRSSSGSVHRAAISQRSCWRIPRSIAFTSSLTTWCRSWWKNSWRGQ
jgi:hypothetical protein